MPSPRAVLSCLFWSLFWLFFPVVVLGIFFVVAMRSADPNRGAGPLPPFEEMERKTGGPSRDFQRP